MYIYMDLNVMMKSRSDFLNSELKVGFQIPALTSHKGPAFGSEFVSERESAEVLNVSGNKVSRRRRVRQESKAGEEFVEHLNIDSLVTLNDSSFWGSFSCSDVLAVALRESYRFERPNYK